MPSINLKIKQLEELTGRELSYEQLQFDLQWISLDIDEYDEKEQTIKVEFNPNRPDFSSPEGIARVLNGYYEKDVGLPQYPVVHGKEFFKVDAKVRKVRPYVVSGLVRFNRALTEEEVITLMHMQEILHWAVGRNRKKVAIGIHDYEQVKGPYRYTTVKPNEVKFRPLHLEAYELTPQEILEEHPKGIEYAHLLDGFKEYPIIFDAEGKVVSFPPVINGTYTTVTPGKTKILFLDLTGTSFSAVNDALNILATTFADMGGQVETVKVIYEDEPDKEIITPDLSPKSWTVDMDYINDYIGLELTPKEMIKCLSKVRLNAEVNPRNDQQLNVQIPAYRNDIMHDVDLVEEVAMGYGYENLELSINEKGFGAYHPILMLEQQVRNILIGAGCLEMVNNILVSKSDITNMNLEYSDTKNVVIANPVSLKYNTTRTWLLVGLLNNLKSNRSAEKPFRLFEVGDVVLLDSKKATKSRRDLHLACLVHSDNADYTQIKSLYDHFARTMGISKDIVIKAENHPTFIEGRTAALYFAGKRIGFIGEISPAVVLNFGLEYPTAGFEIDLTQFS